MKRILTALAALALIAGSAVPSLAGMLDDIRSRGTVRIGVSLGGEPIGFRDDQNNPVLATDPGWAAAFRWQRQLIDFYGYDNIVKFFAANTNNEFNKSNAFQAGKVAMTFDGEWRTAFIKRGNPSLNYGTVPFPAADDHPDVYGSSRVGGTVVGIPKGAKHPDQAWLLVKAAPPLT